MFFVLKYRKLATQKLLKGYKINIENNTLPYYQIKPLKKELQ
jgi:hypothetical protein